MTLLYEDHVCNVSCVYRSLASYNRMVKQNLKQRKPLPQPQSYGLSTLDIRIDPLTGEAGYVRG